MLLQELAGALRAVRAAVAETSFPLPLPSAVAAREGAAAVLAQIDDYLSPRLANLDAPMLVVVGGSTGAGKSTLVNSLVRAPVSATGILRPTTRTPVLVSNPADTPWFGRDRLLAAVSRSLPEPLRLISAPALPRGLAFLDAPDIDSVVDSNRALASQLFAAADLWLFVTSATRYADAVPWRLLHAARSRGTVIALVVARVPPSATVELVGLVSEMLTATGLASVPLFVIPETRVDRQGLLPDDATAPLRGWFEGLAGDLPARSAVIRCTLDGALAALPLQLAVLAAAAEEQLAAAELLAEQVGLAYGVARATIERGVRTGPAPPASVEARPLDEFSRALRTSIGNWRDRLAGVTGRRTGTRHRQTATDAGLVTLVRSAATDAADQTDSAWRSHPAGPGLLYEAPGPSPELIWQVQRIIREQPRGVLLDMIGQLLDGEAARWLERLIEVPLDGSPSRRLRDAGVALDRARRAAHLASAADPVSRPRPGLVPEFVPDPRTEKPAATGEPAADDEPETTKETAGVDGK